MVVMTVVMVMMTVVVVVVMVMIGNAFIENSLHLALCWPKYLHLLILKTTLGGKKYSHPQFSKGKKK